VDITLAPTRGRRRSFAGVAVLLLIGLLIAATLAVYVGSRRSAPPPPFGPAANGSLFYTGADGVIYAMDSVTATPRAVVTGAAATSGVLPSRDGTRISFTRGSSDGVQMFVADADGSNVRPLAGTYSDVSETDWSPSGDELAIISFVDGYKALSVLPTDGSAARTLTLGVEPHDFWYLPSGRLVFKGDSHDPATAPTYGIYVANADGTGVRPIMAPSPNESDIISATPTPDGRSLVYHRWREPDQLGRLAIIDIEAGTDRLLGVADPDPFEDYNDEGVLISPDGTKVLFTRYLTAGNRLMVAPITGGKPIAIGEVSAGNTEAIASFSPDGRSVLAYYPASGHLLLLDPTGVKPAQPLDVPVADVPAWQRVAP